MGLFDIIPELRYQSRIRKFNQWLDGTYGISWNSLADQWWNVPRGARYEIAKRLHSSYASVNIKKVRESSASPWINPQCLNFAIVRCCILNNMSYHDALKVAQYESNGRIKQHVAPEFNNGLGLPVFVLSIASKTFGHAINAIQVVEDYSMSNSYVFFDKQTFDIDSDGSYSLFPRGCKMKVLNHNNFLAEYHYDRILPKGSNAESSIILCEFEN